MRRQCMVDDDFGEVSELAEGARLEIVLVGKTCHVGSNPTLSAMNE